MVFFRVRPSWQLRENQVSAESHWHRRRFTRNLIGAAVTTSLLPLGCESGQKIVTPETSGSKLALPKSGDRQKFAPSVPLPLPTAQELAFAFNNYYEFGRTKSIVQAAQALPTKPWQVEVTGLVNHPLTLDLDDLMHKFPLEERIYRFRCVEAWAMVVPWLGFPMQALLKAVDPKPQAKFVRFTSFYDRKITLGPEWLLRPVPWPYQEGLRIEEMANELAFFAVGMYGKPLPKQNGAPIRMVIPWKYGFKGAKSIIKIEFLDTQPATFWNTLLPNEYSFEANVDPRKPHPRWSQASERLMGSQLGLAWEQQPTLLYNGYAEYVAYLY